MLHCGRRSYRSSHIFLCATVPLRKEWNMEPPASPSKLESERNCTYKWKKKINNYASKVYERLYLDEETADVHFICGTRGERIPCHKIVLSKSSPYFDAMFYGPNANDKDKDYTDRSPTAFKDLLKLCYLNEVEIGPDDIVEVIGLAHETLMTESLKICGEIWAENMTIEDVCEAYHCAIRFDMDELKEFCERKISAYPKEVFATDDFLSCEFTVLNQILQLETLLCDEKTVLQAAFNWATKACEIDGLNGNEMANLRIYLKDSLNKIRYQSMTTIEFREIFDSKDGNFFNIEEFVDIIRLTTGSRKLRSDLFNPKPRSSKIVWKEYNVIECKLYDSLNLSKETFRSCDTQLVTLKSSRPILLGGIWCAPATPSAMVTVTIAQKRTSAILHTSYLQLTSTTKNGPYLDLTKSPIVFRPLVRYEISIQNEKPSATFPSLAHILGYVPNSDLCYYASKYDRSITLNKETTIEVDNSSYCIMRGLRFNVF